MAGIRRPLLALESAQASQDSGESGIVASAHGEFNRCLPGPACADFAVVAADLEHAVVSIFLDAARHPRDDVAEEGADADLAVLGALLVAGEPLFGADAVDDGAALFVVEFGWEARVGTVGEGAVDRVHDAGEAGVRVDGYARGRGGHPFGDEPVEVVHFFRFVPWLCQWWLLMKLVLAVG